MASPKTIDSDSSSLHEDSDSSSLHEEDPSTRPEAERSQWCSGYDCQFVGEILPEEGECPICHLIYRHPYQLHCGKRICKECMETIRAKSQLCPFCNEVDVTSFPDVAHMQYLGRYNVNCHNRSEGCEWEGELSDLDRHLNLEPTTEKQLKGCLFSRIKCHFCFELFERRFIDSHQSRECPKRPYECEYCEYSASFEEVTQQHSNECPSAPVTCPNNCELVVFRSDLQRHRKHDCPLEMQQCEFRAVGCQVELSRRDMPEHKRQSVAEHSVALSTTLQRAMEDITTLQGDITTLQGDITTLQRDITSLRGDITTLQGDSTSFRRDITSLRGNITSLRGDNTSFRRDITSLRGDSTSFRRDSTSFRRDIASLRGDITTLRGDITTLQGDSTSFRRDSTSFRGNIASLRGDSTSFRRDSTSFRRDITSLRGDITTLQGKMQSLIANNEQTTGAMQDSLNAMRDSLNAMRDGQDRMQERITSQSTRLWRGVALLAIVTIVSIAVLAGVVVVTMRRGQRYREDNVCDVVYNFVCNLMSTC